MTFGQSSDENSKVVPLENAENNSSVAHKHESSKRTYECSYCHERFRNKDALDRHVYHHTNEKKYSCSFVGCLSSFTNATHLRRHNKRVHSEVPLQLTIICTDPTCASMFSTVDNMRRHYKEMHVQSQQGDKYVCNICGACFHRKQQLKRHAILHTGCYPYKCEVCGKGAVNLKAHIRHRASHVHECNVCGRIFKHWSGLVAHKKIGHVTEYKCETCQKVFISKKNLNYHQKIHLNSADRDAFQCPYDKCAKFYTEKRNLMAHIRSKHEGRKFICGFDDCGQQISTKQKLQAHLKLHLSEKMGTKSKPNSRRSSVDSIKKVRKDKGKKKVSAVSIISGIVPTAQIEKTLLDSKGNEILILKNILPTCSNSSDVSDVETTIQN